MNLWGKNPAPAAAAGAGVGEVPVQKVNKIEVLNLISRPSVYGGRAPRGAAGGRAAEAGPVDINKKAEEFIKERKLWFHRQKPAGGPAAAV